MKQKTVSIVLVIAISIMLIVGTGLGYSLAYATTTNNNDNSNGSDNNSNNNDNNSNEQSSTASTIEPLSQVVPTLPQGIVGFNETIGPQGEPGANGTNGEPGPQGERGPIGTLVVTPRNSSYVEIAPQTFGIATAFCNIGEVATGGSYQFGGVSLGEGPPIVLTMMDVHDKTTLNSIGWQIEAYNPSSSYEGLITYAECLSVVP
jgi:hypothetical protein